MAVGADAIPATTPETGKILTEFSDSKEKALSASTDDTVQTPQDDAIPDGGFQAWLQVVGAFFIYFNSWGFVNTFGTFETYYIVRYAPRPASDIAWIGTMEGFLLVVVGIITGSFHDRGFFRSLVVLGSFLVVFGLMMTSICTEYWQTFLAQGVCVGLGSACIFLPSLVVVATWFNKNRGFATGITVAGGQLGGVIYPIVFRQLNEQIGFGWAVRVLGFIALGLLAISNVILKPRVPPTGKGYKFFDASAFREAPYLVFSFGLFVTFVGLYQPLYYTPTYGEVVLGMDLNSSFYLTAVTNAASMAGCIIPSIVGDRLGYLNLIIPSGLLTGMLAFVWIGVKSIPGLYAFVAFYGFFTGCLISLPNPILVGLSPSLQRVGARVGMSYTFAAFGLLIGSPIGGLLLDIPHGHFLRTQIFGGCMVFGGTILFALAKFLHVRQQKKL